jgi:hypothetical protein
MIVKKTKVIVTRSVVSTANQALYRRALPRKGVGTEISPTALPGFPVEVGGVGELHPAFFRESRTPGR